MRRLLWLVAFIAGFAGASAALAENEEASCKVENAALVLWFGERDVLPGAVINLKPSWSEGPHSFTSVAQGCVSHWQLSDPNLATVSADQQTVTIAASAPAGTLVVIKTSIGGQELTGELRVYRSDLQPLIGRWRQPDADCPTGNPIRELRFTANGEFSVTAMPFESYKDYWGKWTYDPATQKLELTPIDGNFIPPDLKPSGTASVSDNRLTMIGLYLGTLDRIDHKPSCEAAFVR